MKIEVLGFDWDESNIEKCKKHGLNIEEIESCFRQRNILVAPDVKHSQLEKRYLAIARNIKNDRLVFIAFTFRKKNKLKVIRPISARYMHKKEIEKYEQENS